MPNPKHIPLGLRIEKVKVEPVAVHTMPSLEYVRCRAVIRLREQKGSRYTEYPLADFLKELGITRNDVRRAWGDIPPLAHAHDDGTPLDQLAVPIDDGLTEDEMDAIEDSILQDAIQRDIEEERDENLE